MTDRDPASAELATPSKAASEASTGRSGPLEIAIAIALMTGLVLGSSRARHGGSFRADSGDIQREASGDIRLSTPGASFEIVGRDSEEEHAGDIRTVRGVHGTLIDGIALEAVLDGALARLTIEPPKTTPDGPAQALAHARVANDTDTVDVEIAYFLQRSPAALAIELRPLPRLPAKPHEVSLRLATPIAGKTVFVPGTGIIADATDVRGSAVVLDSEANSVAITIPKGEIGVHAGTDEVGATTAMIVAATTPPVDTPFEGPVVRPVFGPGSNGAARLVVVTGRTPQRTSEGIARVRGERFRSLGGRVIGGGPGVEVWGTESDGRPVVHARPDDDGRFVTIAPEALLGWYATNADTRASPIVLEKEPDGGPIELMMLPGGELHLRIRDADTEAPLTSRLVVHGIAPTADPNFGPDYRASGAGPVVDSLRGDATMPLPAGRYRILATRGLEYTIDERIIDVAPGSSQRVDLSLRHVIDTPGLVGCDFHVHARPSFDAPVLVEDRVLSLVSAGVDFAVASEHNHVGHYAPALAALDLAHDLASVPGIEVTTSHPSLGHFNIFPYDEPKIPAWRKTTVRRIFAAAREGDPTRILQVNHPRLAKGIGYFDIVGLDTTTMHSTRNWRDDFDSLEVYNGYGAANRPSVEAVLWDWLRLLKAGHRYVATGDSDSHRIQYQWAGYPRTYVRLTREQAGDDGAPIDVKALIDALRAGQAFVTSGPILSVDLDGVEPGGTVPPLTKVGRLHIRVRAAPWIDVSEVEVLLGTTSVSRFSVPSRKLVTGVPMGSLDDARQNAVRYDGYVDLAAPDTGGFVVVVVRGTRAMDDVLPYMPLQPLAFSNPIWIAPRALAATPGQPAPASSADAAHKGAPPAGLDDVNFTQVPSASASPSASAPSGIEPEEPEAP